MLEMVLAKFRAHVLVKLLVILNVCDDLFERGQRFQKAQHAKFIIFELNDSVIRVVIRIFFSDSWLMQQGLVVQQRH